MNSINIPCPVLLHYNCDKQDIGKKYILEEFIENDLLLEHKDSLKYGGWDIEVVNMSEKYSINKTEYDLNNLLCDFEVAIFSSMLALRLGKNLKCHTENFLENCKSIIN